MKNFNKIVGELSDIIFIADNNTYEDNIESWEYKIDFYYHGCLKKVEICIDIDLDGRFDSLDFNNLLYIYIRKIEPEGINGIELSGKYIYEVSISDFSKSIEFLRKIAFCDTKQILYNDKCVWEIDDYSLPFSERILENRIEIEHNLTLDMHRKDDILILGEIDNDIPSFYVACDEYYNNNALKELQVLYNYLKKLEAKYRAR